MLGLGLKAICCLDLESLGLGVPDLGLALLGLVDFTVPLIRS